MKVRLRFRLERETKGAVRYEELLGDTDTPAPMGQYYIGTLYLRKTKLAEHNVVGNEAEYITVTIEA